MSRGIPTAAACAVLLVAVCLDALATEHAKEPPSQSRPTVAHLGVLSELERQRAPFDLLVGLDTFIGPAYIAGGLTEGGNSALYLFVGRLQ